MGATERLAGVGRLPAVWSHPRWLGILLVPVCTLQSLWWSFWTNGADIIGHYIEINPRGDPIVQGEIKDLGGGHLVAIFPSKAWSPSLIYVRGSAVYIGEIVGVRENGALHWPTIARRWVPLREGAPPPGESPAGTPAPDDGAEACSWRPVVDHGQNSTVCYGHSVKHHDDAQDAAQCMDSYAGDNVCNFVSFDASTGRCWCKHSCPAPVLKASTVSFEKMLKLSGISGHYVEYSPEGKETANGTIFQRGARLTVEFPLPWSPASGYLFGSSVILFNGAMNGSYSNGTISWRHGYKWVFLSKITELSAQLGKRKGPSDARSIVNAGWVGSRDQTPHIVQEPSELVNFAWRAVANVTCEVSEQDVRHYDEHGWVLLKQVLDPGALDLILDEARAICERQLATRGVCQIEQLRWQVNRMRDFMLYSPMGCYADKLIRGKGVRITTEALFGTQYNEKDPSFFSYTFHLDSMQGHRGVYHAFTSKSRGVSVWFPMHDVDPDVTGGSVYVVDGYTGDKVEHHCKYAECGGQVTASHSLQPPSFKCSAECWKYRWPAYEHTRRALKFAKGDAVFWHPEMPHATQPVRIRNFTRHSFTIRLVDSEAEVCNVGGACGDWMGCCADLPLANGKTIQNHCFPQIYPEVLDEEVAAHYSSTPKHLMGDQSWVDFAHTIKRAADCV